MSRDVSAKATTPSGRRAAGAAHRVRARRACVAVLTGLAAFAALQLGLAVAIDSWLPGLRDPDYGARLDSLQRRLRSAPAKSRTVVMLGSSRTYLGFRAGSLDEPLTRELGRPVTAFNFGSPGYGMVAEWFTWRRLRGDGVRPDLLLIDVTLPWLNEQIGRDELGEELFPTERLRWQDVALLTQSGRTSRPGLWRDWVLSAPFRCYQYRSELLGRVAPNLLPPTWRKSISSPLDASGCPPPFPSDTPRIVEATRRQTEPTLQVFRLGGPGPQALRDLLASCRADGVPAALVVMPEGPAYRSWYPPEVGPHVLNWVDQVGRDYGVPVIDAREWMDEDDFLDSHHLLAHGAARFTDRLGREAILPLLRRLPEP